MGQPAYCLDQPRRRLALAALTGASDRRWRLLCAQVRSTHVHVVVCAFDTCPELVMSALKAKASKALNAAGVDPADQRRWSRHGSTRYLWNQRDVRDCIRYVVDGQGEQMEVFVDTEFVPMPD